MATHDATCEASDAAANRRRDCNRCKRPQRVCLCPALPEGLLRLSGHVLVLQHPHELKKRLATVPLLRCCLDDESLTIATGRKLQAPGDNPTERLLEGAQRGLYPLYVLFPGPDARDLAALAAGGDHGAALQRAAGRRGAVALREAAAAAVAGAAAETAAGEALESTAAKVPWAGVLSTQGPRLEAHVRAPTGAAGAVVRPEATVTAVGAAAPGRREAEEPGACEGGLRAAGRPLSCTGTARGRAAGDAAEADAAVTCPSASATRPAVKGEAPVAAATAPVAGAGIGSERPAALYVNTGIVTAETAAEAAAGSFTDESAALEAAEVAEAAASGLPPPAYLLLVIDGTWRQAREMFKTLQPRCLLPGGPGILVALRPEDLLPPSVRAQHAMLPAQHVSARPPSPPAREAPAYLSGSLPSSERTTTTATAASSPCSPAAADSGGGGSGGGGNDSGGAPRPCADVHLTPSSTPAESAVASGAPGAAARAGAVSPDTAVAPAASAAQGSPSLPPGAAGGATAATAAGAGAGGSADGSVERHGGSSTAASEPVAGYDPDMPCLIRKEPVPGFVTTYEATARAVGLLERDPAVASVLLQPLRLMTRLQASFSPAIMSRMRAEPELEPDRSQKGR